MNQEQEIARAILIQLGGVENIIDVIHCATRLRFLLKEETLVQNEAIKNIPGVVGVVKGKQRYQIIIGTTVDRVYEQLLALGVKSGDQEQLHPQPTGPIQSKQTINQRVSSIIETISQCMTPMIPALTAAGIIKVILALLTSAHVLATTDPTYRILDIIGDSAFYFMPFLLAVNAARKFHVETSLALIVVGVLLHPNFVSWVATGEPISFFQVPIRSTIYAASVIPALLMVWIMSYIQKGVDRMTPSSLKLLLNPALTLLFSAVLALVLIGPLGSFAGDALSAFLRVLSDRLGFFMVALLAAAMPFIVMTGMHHALTPIFLATFAATGQETLILVSQICANLAQAGATWAVAVRSKNKQTKQLASAAGISAIMGITEPAIYGITLKLKRPMLAAALGAGIAGLFGGITHVTLYVMQNSLMAALAFIGDRGMINVVYGIAMMLLAVVASFILCLCMGFDEEEEPIA